MQVLRGARKKSSCFKCHPFIQVPSSHPMLVSHSDGVLDVDADDGDVVVGLVRLGVRLHVRDVHHRLHAAAHAPKHRVLNMGAIISQIL